MITGEVKNKVDKIWTDIWAGDQQPPHCHRTAALADVYPKSEVIILICEDVAKASKPFLSFGENL